MQIIVTSQNRQEWEARLVEAQSALHSRLLGKQPTSLSYDGESISYATSSIAQLRAYISQIEQALGSSSRLSRPRAKRVIFR